ncbi:carotenoid oxygenase family protein [Emcibacter sp.]|uniref:carotenoid oxygenase family protein n=1 Tax=Emcibacter sp. TaxID=1979954 RepID=UPI003A915C3C
MDRRLFLQQAGILGLTAALPQPLWALVEDNLSVQQAFHKSLQKNPWLLGHANVEQERDVHELKLEGKIPEGFEGTFYRNGPALQERGGIRYAHLFEGDGMIRAFRFGGGKVSYRDRFVKTPKFIQEEKAGRFLYDGSGTDIPDSLGVGSPDATNVANTSILPVGNDIWALWEGGSATRLAADSLDTKGFVALGEGLQGMPFSAHPKVDPNGDIWNVGLDNNRGRAVIYHLSSAGQLKKVAVVPTGYHSMLHDFLVTEKHVLLILPSLDMGGKGFGFFGRMNFRADQPVRLMVLDKNDLTVKRQHDLPPGFMFHFGNAWEEKDGTIHFDCCRYENLDVMTELAELMRGEIRDPQLQSEAVFYQISPTGKVTETRTPGQAEFPRLYPRLTGLKNKSIYHAGSANTPHWMNTIRRLEPESGKTESYSYGDGFLVEEHIVVEGRDRNTQAGGWLVGTALHWPTKRSCVSIFEAENLSAGPVARAWLDFPISLGFHGNFARA